MTSCRKKWEPRRGGIRMPLQAILTGAALCGTAFFIALVAYQCGTRSRLVTGIQGPSNLSEAIVHATASHGTTNVAVATGQMGEDSEGIFILDYLTGNLQCWVYYPRYQRFGGKFETNVTAQLPATKNAEYLLVTGVNNVPQATSIQRPAGCLAYVVDVKSGMFAAYSIGWSRTMEASGDIQSGPIVCVGGDQYRTPAGGSSAKKPLPVPAPAKDLGKDKAIPK